MATESVKINSELVEKVREQKKETGIPVGKYFELAAEEKLKKDAANIVKEEAK